jgi:hypothetical protein
VRVPGFRWLPFGFNFLPFIRENVECFKGVQTLEVEVQPSKEINLVVVQVCSVVDAKRRRLGVVVFYRMQLLHLQVEKVHMLFVRREAIFQQINVPIAHKK